MSNSGASMGDLFNQRRAAKQQQQQDGSSSTGGGRGGGTPTLLEIQAEQEREAERRSNNYNSRNMGGGGGYRDRSDRDRGDRSRRNDYNNNNDRRRGGGGERQARDRDTTTSSSNNNRDRGQRQSRDRDMDREFLEGLPLEQGLVCSIRDSFGFIYCADRPDQIFFHFSQVQGCHPADLEMDQEVEFRVGIARNDSSKLSAYAVRTLQPGTIQWEIEDEPGKRFQGLVERPIRMEQRGGGGSDKGGSGGGGSNNPQLYEGTVRMLIVTDNVNGEKKKEEEDDKDDQQQQQSTTKDDKEDELKTGGPIVRFTSADIDTSSLETATKETNGGGGRFRRSDSSSSNKGQPRLSKNDLVEFTLVTERRTQAKYARKITLLQSDRDRQRQKKEKRLLANATQEEGVVTALKNDFGFLKTTSRREEVYFHYSNVILPEEDEVELQVGQDMKFLVVAESSGGGGGSQRGGGGNKLSARQIQFLPKGSVQFHKTMAQGVTGIVTRCPHPADSSYSNEMTGKLRLSKPLSACSDKEEKDGESKTTTITEVSFRAADAPGGSFSNNRDGSSVGTWVREGDTLLFDVVQELMDGMYYAYPTSHTQPRSVETGDDNTSTTQEKSSKDEPALVEENATVSNNDESSSKAIRMVSLCLAGRAEGVIHAIKDNYGFIHCAERPVDAYFRLYEVLPESVQSDVRGFMGLSNDNGGSALKLTVGAEIQFDLSLQGTVATGNSRSRGKQHERDNLKAQRILVLPPSTILQDKVLAKGIKGVVDKEDPKQPFAGMISLEKELKGMTPEERHPLVAKLIESVMEGESPIIFPDLQSPQEDAVVMNMADLIGHGKIDVDHIGVSKAGDHPGRLRVSKAGSNNGTADTQSSDNDGSSDNNVVVAAAADSENKSETDASPSEKTDDANSESNNSNKKESAASSPTAKKSKKKKKKHHKVKPIKLVRYDKHCLPDVMVREGLLLGKGDVIKCDIVQSRRSGAVTLTNIEVTERKKIERGTAFEPSEPKEGGVGIVTEVVAARQFGFISVLDENATKREQIFFHTSAVLKETEDRTTPSKKRSGQIGIRKGDEVKFDIEVGKNGKRTATSVQVLPKGTLNIATKAEKNACTGIVLMEPSHTTLSNTPIRHSSHGSTGSESSGGGRWGNVGLEDKTMKAPSGSSVKEEGSILLLVDPTNSFCPRASSKKDSATEKSTEAPTATADAEEKADDSPKDTTDSGIDSATETVSSALLTHVPYKNGAIALQGSGASSGTDGSCGPRRGDLVSFLKTKGGKSARDIRVVTPKAATMVRGKLTDIEILPEGADANGSSPGTAKFTSATEKEEVFEVDLIEVVSCAVTVLKENDSVEGILHEGKIFGICRTTDLYLESKLGNTHRERPKLNLTVRKELKGLGGKIMAQSGMAKGPDGTTGFAPGWTDRTSQYLVQEEEAVLQQEDVQEEEFETAEKHGEDQAMEEVQPESVCTEPQVTGSAEENVTE
mmetsp:Transcript_21788/g.30717  ORF Transcript_21788/g.30717 Transcript_21788/m.30717 type:complete len:1474 (-) Transcript_21788:2380-6801(-)